MKSMSSCGLKRFLLIELPLSNGVCLSFFGETEVVEKLTCSWLLSWDGACSTWKSYVESSSYSSWRTANRDALIVLQAWFFLTFHVLFKCGDLLIVILGKSVVIVYWKGSKGLYALCLFEEGYIKVSGRTNFVFELRDIEKLINGGIVCIMDHTSTLETNT